MDPQPPRTSSTTTRRFSASGFVRGLTLALVSLFVILMAIIAIAWLALKPHEPGFRVSSLSVSNFTVSDSQLRGRYVVGLTITNPNEKIQVVLDDFIISVCYDSVGLVEDAVQPVYLEKMSDKDLKVELRDDSPKLAAREVVSEDLVKDWSKGVVNFDVKMQARTRFEAGILPTKEKLFDVYCGDLDVGFFHKDTGKLLGIGKDCHVKIRS